jgi:hypothetical protein
VENEIYKFLDISAKGNIETRLLIPTSTELQELVSVLNKYSNVRFQRLYKPLNGNFVLFIADSKASLELEFKKDDRLSTDDKKYLIYSNKEGQVQSLVVLFENCWILHLVHEKMSNR